MCSLKKKGKYMKTKERSRIEYSILNMVTGLGGYALNTILGFICRIVFVKCLSADYLGVNGLFTNILTMLSLAELGVGEAIVFALYKPLAEQDKDKIASLVKVYGRAYKIIGLAVLIIGLAIMPFLNVIIREQPQIRESIIVLYLINLFNTASTYFFSYRSSLLIAAQKNYMVSGINYLVTIIQSILQMIFLVFTHNYLVYLLIQTIGIFIYNVVISKKAIKEFPYIEKKDIKPLQKEEQKKIFANVRDLMLYKISGLLVNSTDNILITFFKGLVTTGIASNYTMLTSTLSAFLNQIFNGLTASIGNHNVTESIKKRHEMFLFLDLMNFWIFSWATLGIYFCSSDLVRICFGREYVLPDSIPFIMAFNFYVNGVTNIIGIYKHTMGIFHYGRFIQILTGILNILLSVILGNYFGLFGILAATAISRICTHVWYTPFVVYIHGFRMSPLIYLKRHIKYLLAILITAILCKFSFQLINGFSLMHTIIKIILCSIEVNVVYICIYAKTAEFKKLKQYCFTIMCKIVR